MRKAWLLLSPAAYYRQMCAMTLTQVSVPSGDGRDRQSRLSVPFRTIAHFYDPDDPSPEENRELSDRAEDTIFRAVADLPDATHPAPGDIMDISLPTAELTRERQAVIPRAVKSFFLQKIGEIEKDRRLSRKVAFREFRLTAGFCIPAFIIIAFATRFPHEPVAVIVQNVLVVFTWVVIWQPFQTLVFDRWSKSTRIKVYRKILGMEIRVKPA
jgi:hypothetical protein